MPANIIKEKKPFLHFPCLFPDGKCGLNDPERKFPLTPQQFLLQRIQNFNPMFADNKAFMFSGVYYTERHQLESKMNISYMRGKLKQSSEGKQFLATEDGFAVFDNIRGSPRYWQKLRYDLLAKLEQCGPFQFFYTLSCANKRWDENLATFLSKRKENIVVMHFIEEMTNNDQVLFGSKQVNCFKKEDEAYYSDEDETEDIEVDVELLNVDTSKHDAKKNGGAKGKKTISDYYVHEKNCIGRT